MTLNICLKISPSISAGVYLCSKWNWVLNLCNISMSLWINGMVWKNLESIFFICRFRSNVKLNGKSVFGKIMRYVHHFLCCSCSCIDNTHEATSNAKEFIISFKVHFYTYLLTKLKVCPINAKFICIKRKITKEIWKKVNFEFVLLLHTISLVTNVSY